MNIFNKKCKSNNKIEIKYKTKVEKHDFEGTTEVSVKACILCETYNINMNRVIYHSINYIDKIDSFKKLISNLDYRILEFVKSEVIQMNETNELDELISLIDNKEYTMLVNENEL